MTPSKRRRATDAAERACAAVNCAAFDAWYALPPLGPGPSPRERRAALKALARARRLLDRAERMVVALECATEADHG